MGILDKKAISVIRVFATILILCCHILPIFDNAILQMSSQFFNVGVHIFIIISAYLYGKRKINENTNYGNWLIKRGQKILVPLYLFLSILLAINIIKGLDIKLFNWIIYIFNLQAMEIYINGAEHLWYLTIAMICYFITILLDVNKQKLNKNNIATIIITLAITQVITSYYIHKQLGIYLIYIMLYIVAYFVGMYWKSNNISKKYLIIYGMTFFLSAIIRVFGRVIFDDTIFYNVFIVGYTQSIIGLSLFFIIFYFVSKFGEQHKFNLVNFFDFISYEVYLVHYMFIVGPVSLVGLTSSKIIDSIIIILISILLATILHKISENIKTMLNYKVKVQVN